MRRYLPPTGHDASGGRVSPTGRHAARTAAVVGIPAPTVDATTVRVSLCGTERVCRTRRWAATSGSPVQRCARRWPLPPPCPRRTAWWGTAAGRPDARATSSSSQRGPGGQGLPWDAWRAARTRSRTVSEGHLRSSLQRRRERWRNRPSCRPDRTWRWGQTTAGRSKNLPWSQPQALTGTTRC